MVEPQGVQQRGVQIVDGDHLVDRLVGEVVGRTVAVAPLDPAASHPQRKRIPVVIAPVGSLGNGEAAEFPRPDHDGRVEQPPAFQVGDQRRTGLIGHRTQRLETVGVLAVRVPRLAVVDQLDEPDTPFNQAAGHQAAGAVFRRGGIVETVQGAGFGGLFGQVGDLRDRGLHAGGDFEVAHAGRQFTALGIAGLVLPVVLLKKPQLIPPGVGGHPVGHLQVVHGGASRAEHRPLVDRGQKARRPVLFAIDRQPARVAQHDIGGEVFVLGPEGVGDPTAKDGQPGEQLARVNQPQRRLVIDRAGAHGPHQADVIDNLAQLGKQFAQFDAAVSSRQKPVRASQDVPLLLVEVGFDFPSGVGLSVVFVEGRFGIKQVHLAGATMLKQADDRLGLGSRSLGC